MEKNEKVLCIKRDQLPLEWVKEKSIVPMKFDQFISTCSKADFDFIDRPTAENDPSFKQVIPYILIQTSDLKKTAIYNRQGSEKRLHDLWSLGIGGHINPVDQKSKSVSFKDILMTGMKRELSEELEKKPTDESAEFIGVISEDITDVGTVHLGAVFRILAKNTCDYSPGSELHQFSWEFTENLKNLNLELWSKLALELI